MADTFKELNPIHPPDKYLEEIESIILEHLKREVYVPLMQYLQIEPKKITNDAGREFNALWTALSKGTVTYNRGKFSGRFNADITRALKMAGATWNRDGTFSLQMSKMSYDLEQAVRSTEGRFREKVSGLDRILRKFVPEDIAERMEFSKPLDGALFQVHKRFSDNVKGLTITPELTSEQRKRITEEWQENLRLYIRTFTDDEVKKLRERVKKTTFAGDRFGSLIKTIQASYGVSAKKAKFLARQETKLLTTKYQESRYQEAGLPEYRWKTVAGTPAHPVRPSHKRLDNTIQRWDKPPVTTEDGEPIRHNNPGQDFGCRCMAIPVVRFKK